MRLEQAVAVTEDRVGFADAHVAHHKDLGKQVVAFVRQYGWGVWTHIWDRGKYTI